MMRKPTVLKKIFYKKQEREGVHYDDDEKLWGIER